MSILVGNPPVFCAGKVKKKFLVIVGNVTDGFDFYGPFKTYAQATQYACDQLDEDATWLVAPQIKEVAP